MKLKQTYEKIRACRTLPRPAPPRGARSAAAPLVLPTNTLAGSWHCRQLLKLLSRAHGAGPPDDAA